MLTWRDAMEQALYAPDGFYRRPGDGPRDHFRTSVHASPLFASALWQLIADVDRRLGHPQPFTVVDLGAGRGELLQHLLVQWPDPDECTTRVELVGVDLAPRPPELPGAIAWRSDLPARITGVIVANEWLDNVPLDVAAFDDGQWRTVLVDPATGDEEPGPELSERDTAWLAAWWPRPEPEPGERVEIGSPRDDAWAEAVRRLDRGLALAIDYSHVRADRADGLWTAGSLTAYREGQSVRAVPDGSCDLTANVAVDACSAAGIAAGATDSVVTSQRSALRALGILGARPPLPLASDDPIAYVSALSRASEEAELIDAAGLGGFAWLAQAKGISVPAPLSPTATQTTAVR